VLTRAVCLLCGREAPCRCAFGCCAGGTGDCRDRDRQVPTRLLVPRLVRLCQLWAPGCFRPIDGQRGGYGQDLFHKAASFMWPVTVLFKLLGTHVIVVARWAALFGAVTTASQRRWSGMPQICNGWAAAAGLTVALVPSRVLWRAARLIPPLRWQPGRVLGYVRAIVGNFLAERSHQLLPRPSASCRSTSITGHRRWPLSTSSALRWRPACLECGVISTISPGQLRMSTSCAPSGTSTKKASTGKSAPKAPSACDCRSTPYG
jgi:hypothetical protein